MYNNNILLGPYAGYHFTDEKNKFVIRFEHAEFSTTMTETEYPIVKKVIDRALANECDVMEENAFLREEDRLLKRNTSGQVSNCSFGYKNPTLNTKGNTSGPFGDQSKNTKGNIE